VIILHFKVDEVQNSLRTIADYYILIYQVWPHSPNKEVSVMLKMTPEFREKLELTRKAWLSVADLFLKIEVIGNGKEVTDNDRVNLSRALQDLRDGPAKSLKSSLDNHTGGTEFRPPRADS
jgi:hypothetical protein